ncbi:MAG: double-strand break repair protein AddB [Azospirillaceae bacterium]|nr:double-strand break repair protein AddB [Azospirillaceae bacterium]
MIPRGITTIPAGVPFLDSLAEGVLRAVLDPFDLPRITILLPTRRACRVLRDAFLRRSGGQPLMLPRLAPMGELDSDEMSLMPAAPGTAPDPATDPVLSPDIDLAPAITPIRRQLVLTRMIMARDPALLPDQAARLAGDLGQMLDQVHTERLGFDRLAGLVPDNYAQHWQLTLDFLGILTRHWPAILEQEGALDATDRRNRLLDAQIAAWRRHPPTEPVIAAGSTGAIPAVVDLLGVVTELPQGVVVLPGLDLAMDPDSWSRLTEDHPQFGMARMLARLGLVRDQVRRWPSPLVGTPPARTTLIAEALRPADTTEAWRRLEAPLEPAAVTGLSRLDCPTAQDEAGAIALMMRGALETAGKTAALVTPDRVLARRVASALGRWGITVDDSGGRPLPETAIGTLMRLIASCARTNAEPVALLSLLKHPLVTCGLSPQECRRRARDLERVLLRGPRPDPGFAGLRAALERTADARFASPHQRRELADWIQTLDQGFRPFFDLVAGSPQPLATLLHAHVDLAESLATSNSRGGALRLWRDDDGVSMATLINQLAQAGRDFPAVAGQRYPALFDALIAGSVVRTAFGLHPRLHILGLQEAQLQHYDLMILGGLNEGCWPGDPSADPWLSRPMRQDFGLPAPERSIGLAAHDFAQAAAAPTVIMTRANRVDGTPTVPSRWLLRLDTVLRAYGAALPAPQPWVLWANELDWPERISPAAPPEPRPPLAVRPRRLSVTQVETWMRDPYAIYARHVLGLTRLDPIAADPGAAERGEFVHQALDQFVRAYPRTLPPDARARLLDLGRAAFDTLLERPEVWAFWWPRFVRIADWFLATEQRRRTAGAVPLATEVSGRLTLAGPGGTFLLTGKADRIDRLPDGTLAIIDYKTGQPPSGTEVGLGFAPQLPLEAAIAQAGGFTDLPPAAVSALAFWRVSGGEPAGEEKPLKAAGLGEMIDQAREGLQTLITLFDDPATPYAAQPRPDRALRFNDYAHLARLAEWSNGGGE